LRRLAGDLHRLIDARVALDIELNAQGLEAWLDATARNTAR